VAHRKDSKEALRRQREEREAKQRAEQRRKRLVGYGSAAAIAVVATAIILLLVAGGGDSGGDLFPEGGDIPEQKVFDVQEAASAAGCELKNSKGSGVATHTASLDEKINYKTNPPTTGRHFEVPAEDGVYQSNPPQDEQLVHTLEHGRVIVWVKPSVPRDARAAIRAIYDEDDGFQTVLVQRRNMPYAVAASAWNRDPAPGGTGRILACNRWSDEVVDAIRAFRDEHRSNGPEDVP
jgi:Protein of unknown function (DUF3105)